MPAASDVYLRKSYGELAAFLYGWMRFVVAGSGSIAIFGVGFATFLSAIVPMTTVWAHTTYSFLGRTMQWQFGMTQVVAIAAILVFAIVNCLTVVVGGRVQTVLTILKVGGIAVVVFGIAVFSTSGDWAHLATPADSHSGGLTAFGLAMLAALWAYDGWNNMPMAAGEVKDPGRNVPRALIGGMVAVMAIYCAANLAYFYALPWGDVLASNSTAHRDALPVATRAAQTAFGDGGGKLMSIAFVLSALGALNGATLTGARVPFAMARDGLFPALTGVLHPRNARACGRGSRSGRMGMRACRVGDLRSVDRLRHLRVVDLLCARHVSGLYFETARAGSSTTVPDARLSRSAARLRRGCLLARGEHARQPPGRVRRRPGAHRVWPACVLVLPCGETRLASAGASHVNGSRTFSVIFQRHVIP